MQFIITSEHAKMRLDKFLKEHFPEFSRAHLQKLIEAGQVQVNGKPVTPHHFLRVGDEVEAVVEPVDELRVVANPTVQFDVLHEELDFIVINKPAGLVVHQGERHKAPDTLANGLLARFPEIGKVGDDPIRPGIMHRLDADVSGVMVVARTQDMFDHLKRQFKVHEVEKEYVALVHGTVSPPSGVIEFAIARKGAKMVARPKTPSGSPLAKGEKRAVTEYQTIEEVAKVAKEAKAAKVTVLRIRTRTGRTHQIRVHLKAIGNPIAGDRLYGLKVERLKLKEVELKRLMLHARKIVFKDLNNNQIEFVVEPPSEFNTNP